MITVKNLNFTYAGTDTRVLHDINFEVAKGEILGFLGPSGAGKSTTQKILIGLLKEFEGEISVMGRDLHSWGSDYYEQVGVSFEIPNHYLKLTALENLTYFSSLYEGKTEDPQALLEMVGLGSDGNLRVAQYSKGMRNRLNVARALLHDPELIFLDEPTAGLDPMNARRIKDLIDMKKKAGKTVFLTTHDMAVADELCDRVAFIVDGRISIIETPRDLKIQHGKRAVNIEFGNNGDLQSREFPLDAIGANADFLRILKEETVQTIHTQETTLENVFIEVTGRSLS